MRYRRLSQDRHKALFQKRALLFSCNVHARTRTSIARGRAAGSEEHHSVTAHFDILEKLRLLGRREGFLGPGVQFNLLVFGHIDLECALHFCCLLLRAEINRAAAGGER